MGQLAQNGTILLEPNKPTVLFKNNLTSPLDCSPNSDLGLRLRGCQPCKSTDYLGLRCFELARQVKLPISPAYLVTVSGYLATSEKKN